MEVRKAIAEEVKTLTQMSKHAFDSDVNVGAKEAGGPPNYDKEKWHVKMMKQGNLFTIIENEEIVGGALLFLDGSSMYVARIFIDPQFHRMGYGIKTLRLIEKLIPDIHIYNLDTPLWNVRTNQFYQKLGYQKVKTDKEFVYYQKTVA